MQKHDWANAEPFLRDSVVLLNRNLSLPADQRIVTLKIYGTVLRKLNKNAEADKIQTGETIPTSTSVQPPTNIQSQTSVQPPNPQQTDVSQTKTQPATQPADVQPTSTDQPAQQPTSVQPSNIKAPDQPTNADKQ